MLERLRKHLKDHTSRRTAAATHYARESGSHRAQVEELAQQVADLVIERDNLQIDLGVMTYERDRAERFLMEARNANVDAAQQIIGLKASLEGRLLQLSARDTMLDEAEAEIARLQRVIDAALDSTRGMLLAGGA
jgi:chromosome segregation ATPase